MHARLAVVALNKLPKYDAISYTWADEDGNATEKGTIFLDGSILFSVTTNYEMALRRAHLRNWDKVV